MVSKIGSHLRALSVFLGVLGFAGCSGDASGSVVVQIRGSAITKAAVDHWMSVIASDASTAPGQPTPRTPDPPHYSACVAYLRAFAPKPAKGQSKPTSELKSECEYDYNKLKLKALYLLISYTWLGAEAAELGLHTTSTEIRQQLAVLKGQFPSESAFQRFLATRGLSIADLILNLKQTLLTKLIQQKLERENDNRHLVTSQRQQALNNFGQEFRRRWTALTDCHVGYIVPICKQYKAPKTAPTLIPPTLPLTNMLAEH